VLLWEALREGLPVVAAGAAAVDPQLPFGREVLRVAGDRDDVDGAGLMGVHVDGEPEVGRQVPGDLSPGLAGIVAAHDIPVLLHEQHVWLRTHRRLIAASAGNRRYGW
jgi:hypothetical protein